MSALLNLKILMEKYHLSINEANELNDLLLFLQNKNFTSSKQLGKYIVGNKSLLNRFPNIIKIRKFQTKDGLNEWFKPALSRNLYKITCCYLDLVIENSNTYMVDDTLIEVLPYDDFPHLSVFESLERFFINDNTNDSDEEKYTIEDLVQIYGGDPSEMSDDEMLLFLETQEPDFD